MEDTNSTTPVAAAHAGLTPSQAMNGNPNRPNNRNRNRRNRNKGKKGNQDESKAQPKDAVPDGAEAQKPPSQSGNDTGTDKGNQRAGQKPKGKKQQQQQKQKQPQQKQQQQQQQQNSKPKGNKRRNRKPKKKYPWRRYIPSGTVDPITLESLHSLSYPPFALVSTAPYVSVPVWPPVEEKNSQENEGKLNAEDIEELNRRRLQEQWGNKAVVASAKEGDKANTSAEADGQQGPDQKRYYNLFDGRALAYYITSQLQFIDPLNRRDLTRDELLNLDEYLRRHGFTDLNVTEAYDAKGITLSSAGAAANTAQGRAEIMQQMARNLLDALFGGNSVEAGAGNEIVPSSASEQRGGSTALQDQYEAMRLQEEEQARNTSQQRNRELNPNATPFGFGVHPSSDDHGGFTIIDDDENPGLRGGNYSATPGSLYSAAHITGRYGTGTIPSSTSPDAFPALPTSQAAAASIVTNTQSKEDDASRMAKKPPAKPSKTLASIAGSVAPTNPEEKQRQWEAREIARKKAMLSRLTFCVDAAAPQVLDSLPRPPQSAGTVQATIGDGILHRNKAFAEALGVKPATVRQQINSGWSRPTDGSGLGLDEFGNELTATTYPDDLISEAKDRMQLVLKLEKKWKSFLADDKAASLPLNPMDRPTRTFVHHYSDFWNLRTESFDPEPRRYIHCVKLLDTHTPRPLLSEATRNWRGPTLQLPTAPKASSDHASYQTTGQTTKSREEPPPSAREPLKLAPRTLPVEQQQMGIKMPGDESHRERPKLELAKRSLPSELPPYEPDPTFNLNEDMKLSQAKKEEKERKKREADELKRKVLELAFASDSEEDSLASDSGSEWEESAPLYSGDDEE